MLVVLEQKHLLPIMLYRLCGANCLGIFCIASLNTERASCERDK